MFPALKIESTVNCSYRHINLSNLTPKQLLNLIADWEEWSKDTSYFHIDNYPSISEKRDVICNKFKNILVLNAETFNKLNKKNKISSNNRLVFHGGCLSCHSQINFGIANCNGCQHFRADWSKPNLSNVRPNKMDVIDTVIIEDECDKSLQVSESFARASKKIIDEKKTQMIDGNYKEKKNILRPVFSVSKSCLLLNL